MGDMITAVIQLIAKGDSAALIGVLLVLIIGMGWLIYRLVKQNEKKDEKIYKIIDDYAKNNITMAEAMNSIKVVLVEIKAKL
jgi:ABC-type antimicrobial peptide transport system permease subunit